MSEFNKHTRDNDDDDDDTLPLLPSPEPRTILSPVIILVIITLCQLVNFFDR